MFDYKKIAQKLICLSALTLMVNGGSGTAHAQRKAAPAPKCSGAWTGTVSYSRFQTLTNSKTVPRVSGRGEDKTDFEMKYNYKARVSVVESREGNGSTDGKATIEAKISSKETGIAKEQNSCDRGKTWKTMTGNFSTESMTSGNATTDANVNVGVNDDGTYSVSVGLPRIGGELTGKETASFSGQCTPKEGKNLSIGPASTTIEGNSLTSEGKDKISGDGNSISGSYSKTWQNVTETITWNLKRCGGPLRLTDITFEDMTYPNWNEWREISEQVGTVDGNWVKIKAKVLNVSGETKSGNIKFKETYKGDKWDGAKPDAPLKDQEVSVSVDPGEEKEVEIMWDSSGYSWYDDGRPRLVQRIKAELEEKNKKTDELVKNLKVAPKPVVLVHGLWSNWKAFETWQNILTTSHSYDWKAFPVGEKPAHGVMNTGGSFMSTSPTNTIEQNAGALKTYIDHAQRDRNAWHVDIVAHSMGGLISRYYIQNMMMPNIHDGRPPVSHLVMLGTPNQGSPCADVMSTAFDLVGKNVEALRQLKVEEVNKFNRMVTKPKGVKFSALAGDPLPTLCKTIEWNDGVVTVPSAIFRVADNMKSKSLHTDLTGTSDFSSFVKPRLAIGPKGDHLPARPEVPADMMADNAAAPGMPRLYGASGEKFVPEAGSTPDVPAQFAKAVKVAGKQVIELEIPVPAANDFGITFMADPKVSVTLVDGNGVAVGRNLADSPEGRGIFRSIFVDKPVNAGTWKLRIENTGEQEMEIVLTTWANAIR